MQFRFGYCRIRLPISIADLSWLGERTEKGARCYICFFVMYSFTLGWVDVMSVPILGLSLGYMYHPLYPSPKYEVLRGEPLPCDPTQWEPDVISLELEAGPAALRMFGSLLAMLADIKV